jgi:ATP-dependent helicase HrpB
MSATLPATALQAWLRAPVVRADGRSFPVDIRYQPPGRREPLEFLAAQIDGALAGGARKVLVFLSGWGPMQRLQRRLDGRDDCVVHLLHSRVPPAQQQLALTDTGAERPSVVLATNIAETSLTIAGVDTVIDSGQVRRPRYDSRRGMDQLETGWISQASAEQRAGRAGRLGPGLCIRLWSREQHGRLPADDPAQIQQVDLAPLALELALWGSPDLELLEAPPPQRLAEARLLLRRLGALDEHGHISAAGRAMAELGLHPRLGRLVLHGREQGRLRAACQLAALLSEGDFARAEAVSADLDWRLQILQRGDARPAQVLPGVLQRVQQLSRQLLQRSGGAAEPASAGAAGALLLAALPDRLARQRAPDSHRYLTVDGFEVALAADDALCREPWLVVAEHDGDRRGARVRLAAAVSEDDIERLLGGQIALEDSAVWDEGRQALSARRTRRLGAIVLETQALALRDEAADALWLELLRARGLDWLQWPAPVAAWLERVRWLGRRRDDWPDFSETVLLADLEQWLAPWLSGIRHLQQLRGLDYLALLAQRLDHAQRQLLERFAPAHFTLPSGAAHRIDYSGDGPPRLAARVQEFYGLDRHPVIGAEPLLLELLSPARRPVQVTQDLPGFWRSSYADVRKDMRGRYPKHFWPEQPWQAPATTTTKNRMAQP